MEQSRQFIGSDGPGFNGPVLLVLLFFMGCVLAAEASDFTASLDRSAIGVGESATLSLTFAGSDPDSAPSFQVPGNLSVQPLGQTRQFSMVNGRATSSLSYNYQITATTPGTYVIPAIEVEVNGQVLRSQPLPLRVSKGTIPTGLAFLKLVPAKQTVYVGEMFPVEIQLYLGARQENLQMPQISGDGFMFGKTSQPTQSRTQIGNQIYTIGTFRTSAVALKTGTVTLGPAICSMVLFVPVNSRSRSLLDEFWGGGVQRRVVNLSSEPVPITVLPLPAENQPPSFNGAVGSFTMRTDAGPTNVAVGDPITLRVEISGQGNFESLPFPGDSDWVDFKLYPPTSSVESTDTLGMAGEKSFERVVIPQKPGIRELPSLHFSFFDPERKTYRTFESRPIAITVRAADGAPPRPAVASDSAQRSPSEEVAGDIVNIKPSLGTVVVPQPPLITRPWFLLLQLLPVAALLGTFIWRKRQEILASNPQLRRQIKVRKHVRTGLKDLARLAEEQQSEAFFATVFRLLQEQLGERLDLPASAITEAVIDERLSDRISEQLMSQLHVLFQACNQARYAPQRSTAELMDLLPLVKSALTELQQPPHAATDLGRLRAFGTRRSREGN